MFWQTTCNAFWHICWHFENMQYFLAVSAIYSDMFSDKYSGTPSAILICHLAISSEFFRHLPTYIQKNHLRISEDIKHVFWHILTLHDIYTSLTDVFDVCRTQNFGQVGLGPLSSGHDPNRSRLQRNLATFARQMGNLSNIHRPTSNLECRIGSIKSPGQISLCLWNCRIWFKIELGQGASLAQQNWTAKVPPGVRMSIHNLAPSTLLQLNPAD